MIGPKVSICIPVYEMSGQGNSMLLNLLTSIENQTYKQYETIVSDHSIDDELEKVCSNFKVTYLKNEKDRGSSSSNLNNALEHASGELIKPMMQDDLFAEDFSLSNMVDAVQNSNWVVAGCANYSSDINKLTRIFMPSKGRLEDLLNGLNYLGDPSTIIYRNKEQRFDPKLLWLMDCDLYYRLFKEYGDPVIIPGVLLKIRAWSGSVTSSLVTDGLIQKEVEYLRSKYK